MKRVGLSSIITGKENVRILTKKHEKSDKELGRQLGTAAALNTVGTFVYFFFQWLTTVLVVRLADFTQAGVFSLLISFTNIFFFIAVYGVRAFQVSDVEGKFTDGQYVGYRLLTCGVSLLLLFVVLLWQYHADPYFIVCAIVYMGYKYLEAATDVLFGVMQRMNAYQTIAVSYFFKGILPVIAFSGALVVGLDLVWAIVGMALAYLAVLLMYDLKHLRAVADIKPVFQGTSPLVKQCFPLMLFTLITPYMTYITRFAIGEEMGSTMLGYYSSISVVVVVMTTIASSIWCVLIPHLRQLYLSRQNAKLVRLLSLILLATAAIGAAAIGAGAVLGEWALALVFGREIIPYVGLLTPVLFASILLTLVSLFSTLLTTFRHTKSMLACNLLGAVLCSISAVPFTKAQGILGANNSLMLGLGVQLLLLLAASCYWLIKNQPETIEKTKRIRK